MQIRESIELSNSLYYEKHKKHMRTIANRNLRLFRLSIEKLLNDDTVCVSFLKKNRVYWKKEK